MTFEQRKAAILIALLTLFVDDDAEAARVAEAVNCTAEDVRDLMRELNII